MYYINISDLDSMITNAKYTWKSLSQIRNSHTFLPEACPGTVSRRPPRRPLKAAAWTWATGTAQNRQSTPTPSVACRQSAAKMKRSNISKQINFFSINVIVTNNPVKHLIQVECVVISDSEGNGVPFPCGKRQGEVELIAQADAGSLCHRSDHTQSCSNK